MNQNKPQRFGAQTYLDPGAGNTNELYPLEDESKVDARRKEIGLEPLNLMSFIHIFKSFTSFLP